MCVTLSGSLSLPDSGVISHSHVKWDADGDPTSGQHSNRKELEIADSSALQMHNYSVAL